MFLLLFASREKFTNSSVSSRRKHDTHFVHSA